MRHEIRLVMLGLATTAACCGPSGSVPQSVTVVDLGTLGGAQSCAQAINRAGHVVGWAEVGSSDDSGPIVHAFLWASGQIRDLGTAGGLRSAAYGINNRDMVVGSAGELVGLMGPDGFFKTHAFSWTARAGMRLLPANNDGSTSFETADFAQGVNDHGELVGGTYAAEFHPALWKHGKLRHLPAINGGSAAGINNQHLIVGFSGDRELNAIPVEWSHASRARKQLPGKYGDPPLDVGDASAINQRNAVAGSLGIDTGDSGVYTSRGVLWSRHGRVLLAPAYGFTGSEAMALNSHDIVAGDSFNVPTADGPQDGSTQHACIWSGESAIDLNSLLPPDSGWVLVYAYGINDAGEVVGMGLHNSVARGFLLRLAAGRGN